MQCDQLTGSLRHFMLKTLCVKVSSTEHGQPAPASLLLFPAWAEEETLGTAHRECLRAEPVHTQLRASGAALCAVDSNIARKTQNI